MQRDLNARIKSNDAPTRTEESEVELLKVDNEWLLVTPPEEAADDEVPLFWNTVFAFMADA